MSRLNGLLLPRSRGIRVHECANDTAREHAWVVCQRSKVHCRALSLARNFGFPVTFGQHRNEIRTTLCSRRPHFYPVRWCNLLVVYFSSFPRIYNFSMKGLDGRSRSGGNYSSARRVSHRLCTQFRDACDSRANAEEMSHENDSCPLISVRLKIERLLGGKIPISNSVSPCRIPWVYSFQWTVARQILIYDELPRRRVRY